MLYILGQSACVKWMTRVWNLMAWSFIWNFVRVSLKYHMLNQFRRHPEAGGVRSRRNEVISEVIEWIGSPTYASDDCGRTMRRARFGATLMRCNGVVSYGSAHFYGDDPWAVDVWHVLLQGRMCKMALVPGSRVGAFVRSVLGG
jgi:hypothetical protein